MGIGDWDYLVVMGLTMLVAGVWLMWGLGAALAVAGVVLIVAGVGGAMGRNTSGIGK